MVRSRGFFLLSIVFYLLYAFSAITVVYGATDSLDITLQVTEPSGGGGGGGGSGSGQPGVSSGVEPDEAPPVETVQPEVTVDVETPPPPPEEPATETIREESPIPPPPTQEAPVDSSLEGEGSQVSTVNSPPQSGGGFGGLIGGYAESLKSFGESSAVKIVELIQDFADIVPEQIVNTADRVVERTSRAIESPAGQVTVKATQPIGVISGGIMVGSQVLLSTTTVTSLSDIYLLFVKLVGILFGLFKRKKERWGTVYDSVTKRPLDPAYVVVKKGADGTEDITEAITDMDGRFGFLLPAGLYSMNAAKTNYEFPSKRLSGKPKDALYDNLYHGEALSSGEGEAIIKNIPLDPVNFDWNEFAKNKKELFRLFSKKERFWSRLFDVIYSLGFFGSALAALFTPSVFNVIFFLVYLVIVYYQIFILPKKRVVEVSFSDGEPIPFAVIKLFSADVGNLVKTVVADKMGRFYVLVGPGKYYLTVDEKISEEDYRTVYKSETLDLSHGIVNSNLVIERGNIVAPDNKSSVGASGDTWKPTNPIFQNQQVGNSPKNSEDEKDKTTLNN